jgi:hypothetical protein
MKTTTLYVEYSTSQSVVIHDEDADCVAMDEGRVHPITVSDTSRWLNLHRVVEQCIVCWPTIEDYEKGIQQ